MKKFYSVIVLVILGAWNSFGQSPVPNKLDKSGSGAADKAVALQRASAHFAVNHDLSSARHTQPVNMVQYIFSDNFDMPSDTDALAARGYHTYYRGGGAQAGPTWFTGNPAALTSHSGAPDSYVAANYAVVSGTNDIDSWLVLPALNLTTSDVITFYCSSIPASPYPDSIKVMYSAAGDSLPEAGSWVLVDNFMASINGWEQKIYSVPSASANGRFAIRYSVVDGGPNGSNSNYIGIDDLNVGQLPADDIAMLPHAPSPYVVVPISQAQPIELEAQITNLGGNTETNVGFDASVYLSQDLGQTFSQVFNGLSGSQASLASGATTGLLTAGSFTFTDTGLYAFQYISYMDNADQDGSNDTITSFMFVDDTTYARDNINLGGTAQAYGAPTGSTVTFGNIYDIYTPTMIKSVTIFHAFATLGGMIRADIYDVSGGYPNSIIASSAAYSYGANDTSSQFLLDLTLPLTSPIAVPSGPVFVSIAQLDQNNMGLGFASSIFTPEASLIQVDADPFDFAENFGLTGTWTVRPNFDLSDGVAATDLSKAVSVFPNPTNGKIHIINTGFKDNMEVNVFNNVGQTVYSGTFNQMSNTVIDLTSQSAGVYTLQIKSDKEIMIKSVVLSGN